MTGDHLIDGHEVLETLRSAPDQRRVVLRTRKGDLQCSTRVVLSLVPGDFAALVREVSLAGRGSMEGGLPDEVRLVLEGYRVRASLGALPGLPEVVDAGLTAAGHPFVATRWVEGASLDALFQGGDLSAERARGLLLELLALLESLHRERVVYGDLKPSNVVVDPDGHVNLIDLDTMRQVPSPLTPVALRDLTRAWAAPEQEERHVSYLASDLYAFGTIAAMLLGKVRPGEAGFPPELPAPWGPIVRACLRPEPLERPTTAAALAAARSESAELEGAARMETWAGLRPADATERVEDAAVEGAPADESGTEHVAEGAPGTEILLRLDGTAGPTPPAAPRPTSLWSRAAWGCAALVLVPSAIGAGAVAWWSWDAARDAESERAAAAAAAEVWESLHAFKTVKALNDDSAGLDAIVAEAARAASMAPSAEPLGVLALATVWQRRWHWARTPWNADAFAETEAVVARSLAAGETTGGLAARAVLDGAACRKMPAGADRDRRCESSRSSHRRALAAIDAGIRRDGPDAWGWLLVEARWSAAQSEIGWSAGRRAQDRTAEARDLAGRALGHCDAARDWLARAPVNAMEMAEDCVGIAGAAGDAGAWFWWADWLMSWDRENASSAGTQAHHRLVVLRGASPECGPVRVGRDGLPVLPGSAVAGDVLHYCAAMGLLAMGCEDEADAYRFCEVPALFGTCLDWAEQPGVPWDEGLDAAGDREGGPCPFAAEAAATAVAPEAGGAE